MALNLNTSLIINTKTSARPSGESHTVRNGAGWGGMVLGLSPREKTAGGKSLGGGWQRTPPTPCECSHCLRILKPHPS